MEKQYDQYPEIGKTYRHYKGGLYKVLFLAKHSETDETMVIYQSELFGSFHARPLTMWFEQVPSLQGEGNVERFALKL